MMSEADARAALVRVLAARSVEMMKPETERFITAMAPLAQKFYDHFQEQVIPAINRLAEALMQHATRAIQHVARAWPAVRTAYIYRALPEYAKRAEQLQVLALPAPIEEGDA